MIGRDERQEKLQQYNFDCACTACLQDYPLYNELKDSLPDIITLQDIDKINLYDLDYVKTHMNKYCKFLTENDRYYPCRQISDVQETLKTCIDIVVGNLTLNKRYSS